jgi:hypothetical protein
VLILGVISIVMIPGTNVMHRQVDAKLYIMYVSKIKRTTIDYL